MNKKQRLQIILDLVKNHSVTSHQALGDLLREKGIKVTQTTLSRDIRELRLIKVPGALGVSQYRISGEWDQRPSISNVLPSLYLSATGSGNLLVVKTVSGGAAAVAYAIDGEDWPEVMGTVAGEDTVFVAVSGEGSCESIYQRLLDIVA